MAKIINTQTQTRRIPTSPAVTPNLENALNGICDLMGAAGYILCGTFILGADLVLVFEQTS
jgi:hypothetical protein